MSTGWSQRAILTTIWRLNTLYQYVKPGVGIPKYSAVQISCSLLNVSPLENMSTLYLLVLCITHSGSFAYLHHNIYIFICYESILYRVNKKVVIIVRFVGVGIIMATSVIENVTTLRIYL